MRTRILTVMLSLVAAGATAQPTPVAPQESLRPSARPFLSTQGAATAVAPDVLGPAGFRDWVAEFRDRALDQGISTSVFDAAFPFIVAAASSHVVDDDSIAPISPRSAPCHVSRSLRAAAAALFASSSAARRAFSSSSS